jgi:hypothetical protein
VRSGGVGNGKLTTASMCMLFIWSTTPSMGIRRISGFENWSKWCSYRAEE